MTRWPTVSFPNGPAHYPSRYRAGRYHAGLQEPWKGVKQWGKGSEICTGNSLSLEKGGDLIREGCSEVPAVFVGEAGRTVL